MKSTIALIGAALMLVVADARSEDIQGWQTFTWGMTGEQIAKATPGTGVVQQPRSSPPKAEFYVDWVMPSLALERETFRVDLRMNLNTGRLAEIVMVDTTSPAKVHA